MTEPIIPLIMCGGAGTRLWPASREGRPKQFLGLARPALDVSGHDLPRRDPAIFGKPIIVTNHQYRFLVAEQLSAIGVEADILLEPHRRDFGSGDRRRRRLCVAPRRRSTDRASRWRPIMSIG